MKKIVFSLFITLLVAAPIFTATAEPAPSFAQIVDHLDGNKNTKLHVQEYWKGIKGQEVTWTGEVYDVQGGSSKAKVYVADKSRPLHKGYNIVVITHDISKAANLKKGQRFRFKGILEDYDSKNPGAVIELKEAQIL